MRRHWAYARYVFRHKWFVFREGLKLRVNLWQLFIHDWSKFLPDEWLPYARYFRNPDGTPRIKREPTGGFDKASGNGVKKAAFDAAWNRHQKRHPHHWQYWLLNLDHPRKQYSTWVLGDGPVYLSMDGNKTQIVVPKTDDMGRGVAELMSVVRFLNNVPEPLPMPDRYRREMLADWRGAGLALGKPDTRGWYLANRDHIQLHPETRAWIEEQLSV